MAGNVTMRADIPSLLKPGLQIIVNRYPTYDIEYSDIFTTKTSEKDSESVPEFKNTGIATEVAEGAATQTDTLQQFVITTFTHVKTALQFILTEETIDDNLYDDIWPEGARCLMQSLKLKKEQMAATIVANSFNGAAQTLADGQPWASSTHQTMVGRTYSNTLGLSTTLTETAIENMSILASLFVDAAGNNIAGHGKRLVVAPQLSFQADRILNSKYRTGTANNDISAINRESVLPEGYRVNHYFSNPNIYLIMTNIPGAIHWERMKPIMDSDYQSTTGNVVVYAKQRDSFGIYDPRSAVLAQSA
jgi:hypothetical protein